MRNTPTQRSLKYLRDYGFIVQVVERWNPWAKIRQDLFGFVDLVATDGTQNIFIQTTSYSNMAARRHKILSIPAARNWVRAGGFIHIHGWKKKSNGRWILKEDDITDAVMVSMEQPHAKVHPSERIPTTQGQKDKVRFKGDNSHRNKRRR